MRPHGDWRSGLSGDWSGGSGDAHGLGGAQNGDLSGGCRGKVICYLNILFYNHQNR